MRERFACVVNVNLYKQEKTLDFSRHKFSNLAKCLIFNSLFTSDILEKAILHCY